MTITNEELLKHLEGRPDESLDEAVHDVYSQSASAVNNEGYEGQAEYLRSEGLSNEEILEAAGGVVPLETTSILTIEITFDSNITDEDSVGVAVDNLLETALSTPDILAEYGNPKIGQTYIQPQWVEDLMPAVPTNGPPYDSDPIAWLGEFLERAKDILETLRCPTENKE